MERRTIPNYPAYAVSPDGRVWSRWRLSGSPRRSDGPWRELKPDVNRKGHSSIQLFSQAGTKKRVGVHRLVLKTFAGSPRSDQDACHRNGNPSHNALRNLKWCTQRQNCADRTRHGRTRMGQSNPAAKLSPRKVQAIKELYDRGLTQTEIARRHGVAQTTVGRILNGRLWRHAK